MKSVLACLPIAFLFFIFSVAHSQNMVPNGGFEIQSFCPSSSGQIFAMDGWTQPSGGTSDAYHTCTIGGSVGLPNTGMGPKMPRTGNGMAGMGIHVDPTWREYIQRELAAPLGAGLAYEVQAYVSLSDFSLLTVSSFGFLFSDTAVLDSSTLPLAGYMPQVANPASNFITATGTNWMLISGVFIATGTEQFLTIGNFDPDGSFPLMNMNTGLGPFTYVFIDDICVKRVGTSGCGILPAQNLDLAGSLDAQGDVNLTWTSSEPEVAEVFQVFRGDSPGNVSLWDFVAGEASSPGSVMVRTDFNPLPGTTWYKVVQVNRSGEEIHSDFIQVESQNSQPLIQDWSLQEDRLGIEFGQFEPGSITLELFDGQGRKLRSRTFHASERTDGGWLSLSQLAPGIYTVVATTASGRREHRKFTWL